MQLKELVCCYNNTTLFDPRDLDLSTRLIFTQPEDERVQIVVVTVLELEAGGWCGSVMIIQADQLLGNQ